MSTIKVGENENLESALRRLTRVTDFFAKKVEKGGVLWKRRSKRLQKRQSYA